MLGDEQVFFAVLADVSWTDVVDPVAEAFAVSAVHVLRIGFDESSLIIFFGFCDDDGAVV